MFPRCSAYISHLQTVRGLARQDAGGLPVGCRAASTASADLISDPSRLFSTNSAFPIDTSAVATNNPLGHNAFADSPELLGRRLAGQSMDGGKVCVADQVGVIAANFAGSAAHFADAAPVAVIRPQARGILKEELSSDGAPIENGRPV